MVDCDVCNKAIGIFSKKIEVKKGGYCHEKC